MYIPEAVMNESDASGSYYDNFLLSCCDVVVPSDLVLDKMSYMMPEVKNTMRCAVVKSLVLPF